MTDALESLSKISTLKCKIISSITMCCVSYSDDIRLI